jgi:ubiquinone biosynthesis protein UbiJ
MSEPSPFDRLKPLVGRALETALNRLVDLDPDTREDLRALEGRRIALALEQPPLALELTVANGRLVVGPVRGEEPDLGIRATLAGVLSQLPPFRRDDAPPVGKVHISGDADLARRLQQLAQRFDPDIEKPFSDLLGPVFGPQLARVLREALRDGVAAGRRFARDGADFLTEESRDLVGRAELAAFCDDVDSLRDDAERLLARATRLAAARGDTGA